MDRTSEADQPEEQEIFLSQPEGTAFSLGILTICSLLETVSLEGHLQIGDWGVLRESLLKIVETGQPPRLEYSPVFHTIPSRTQQTSRLRSSVHQ